MAGGIQQYLSLPVLSGRLKDKRLQKEKHKLETVRRREKDRELQQHTRAVTDFIRQSHTIQLFSNQILGENPDLCRVSSVSV